MGFNMLDLLYTEAIKKKGLIKEDVEDIFDSKLDVESKWNDEKIISSDLDLVLAAGDGSFNKKKFIGFNFYAVGAESLIYNPKNPNSRLQTVETAELGIIPHQKFVDDRLRNMMNIFEIKTSLKSFNNNDIDYYMVDGSILGDLIRPVPIEKNVTLTYDSSILKKIEEKLLNEVKSDELNISSFKFKEEFKDLFNNKKTDENTLISFLENLERLLCLKHLFKYQKNLISISKTSTSTDIFHANVPDIAIFDKFTRNEGFSKPYYKKVTNEVKRDFPISNIYFRNLWFTIFLQDWRIIKILLK